MKKSPETSRFCRAPHPLIYGLMMGTGIGLATRNVGIGIAVGVIFAIAFGAFGRSA